MRFDVVGSITQVETIVAGLSIKVRSFLRKTYGRGRWRKLKGVATVRLPNGELRRGNCIGMKLTASAKETLRLRSTWTNNETTD